MTATRILEGMCRCEAVQHRVEDAFEYALFCNCNWCRWQSSSSFKAIAGLPSEKVEITAGVQNILFLGDLKITDDLPQYRAVPG